MNIYQKCPACVRGDCYGHTHEFLDSRFLVRVCRCPDPDGQHGKMRPPKNKDNHQ